MVAILQLARLYILAHKIEKARAILTKLYEEGTWYKNGNWYRIHKFASALGDAGYYAKALEVAELERPRHVALDLLKEKLHRQISSKGK